MEDVESLGDHGCTVKAFDELLATYSAKALEFQVVQMERSQTKGEELFEKQFLLKKPNLKSKRGKPRMACFQKVVVWFRLPSGEI